MHPYNTTQFQKELYEIGVEDGLIAEKYCNAYFCHQAIDGTDYDQHRIDSMEKFIMAAAACNEDAIDLMQQTLTKGEFDAIVA